MGQFAAGNGRDNAAAPPRRTFRFTKIHLNRYRCFAALDLALESDLTVLFTAHGGDNTAVLTALAIGLTPFQAGTPRGLKLDRQGDVHPGTSAGPCTLAWTAAVGAQADVRWASTVHPASRRTSTDHRPVLAAIEQLRVPGARWPLFAFYGVDRMGRGTASTIPIASRPDRWEGYQNSLNAAQDDSALLTWLLEEFLADVVRRQVGEAPRFLAETVMNTIAKATPEVLHVWYDPRERSPVVRFVTGAVVPWRALSDGVHAHLALLGDIARRALELNEPDGRHAPALVDGVVLIDAIDLHLSPHRQSMVLDGLKDAFPRLQFVVTTCSPQVLRSAETRHVRHLVGGTLQAHERRVPIRPAPAGAAP